MGYCLFCYITKGDMCNLTYLLCFVGIEGGIEPVSVEALISV